MSTVREIITQSLEEIAVARNDRTIRSRDGTMALERLNVLVPAIFGQGVGEQLSGTAPTSAETVLPNTRAIVSGQTAAFTLTLPLNPQDGARFSLVDGGAAFATYPVTVARNGRLLEGSAANLTANTNGYNRTWFFRADLADWKRITTLAMADEFPFPPEFDDAFVIGLALRLTPRYRATMSNESAIAMQRAMNGLRARYRQTVNTSCDLGVLNLSTQTYDNGWDDIIGGVVRPVVRGLTSNNGGGYLPLLYNSGGGA